MSDTKSVDALRAEIAQIDSDLQKLAAREHAAGANVDALAPSHLPPPRLRRSIVSTQSGILKGVRRKGPVSALGQKQTCALQEAVCRASAIQSIALSGAVVAVMRNRLTELAD